MAPRSALYNVMLKAADKAARGLKRDFGEVENLQVSRKGPADFVSTADHRAEKTIREELEKARPGYGFLMEESEEVPASDASGRRWIVDPLDGTSNFLHGLPHFAISIALEERGDGADRRGDRGGRGLRERGHRQCPPAVAIRVLTQGSERSGAQRSRHRGVVG